MCLPFDLAFVAMTITPVISGTTAKGVCRAQATFVTLSILAIALFSAKATCSVSQKTAQALSRTILQNPYWPSPLQGFETERKATPEQAFLAMPVASQRSAVH